MILINLAKQPVHSRQPFRVEAIPMRVVKSVTIGASLLLCIILMYYLYKYSFLMRDTKETVAPIVDDYTPSVQTSPQVVEEIVPEKNTTVDKLQTKGMLTIPYEKLSFIEKVNYEIHFTKNVLELLGRVVVKGVDFKTITLNSFTTVSGVGLSKSREKVTEIFTNLREEKMTILPKPLSQINPVADGYQFTISSQVDFGLNLESPFLLSVENLLSPTDVEAIIKRMVETARDDSIEIIENPIQEQTSVDGKFRRFYYRFSGKTSYNNFANFVVNLYRKKIPIAFAELKLVAIKVNVLKVDARILITTTLE